MSFETSEQKTSITALVALILVLIGMCVYGSWSGALNSSSPPRTPVPTANPADDSLGAWAACQEFVTRRLKAPDSADFPLPSTNQREIARIAPGEYRITSQVQAVNSFNVKQRIPYICEVSYQAKEDAWKLESLDMQE